MPERVPVGIRPDGSIAPMSNPMYKSEPPYTGAWSDCAYDPETPGWIHHPGARTFRAMEVASAPLKPPPAPCTDQICVPSQIDEVVRLFTKAVLREQPDDASLTTWSRDWFAARVAERGARPRTPPPPPRACLVSQCLPSLARSSGCD